MRESSSSPAFSCGKRRSFTESSSEDMKGPAAEQRPHCVPVGIVVASNRERLSAEGRSKRLSVEARGFHGPTPY